MTEKRVRLNENVHNQLLYLKKQTKAKSINDVITSLMAIAEEFYINEGLLKVADKKVSLKYNNGELVEIKFER